MRDKNGSLKHDDFAKASILNEAFVNYGTVDNGVCPKLKPIVISEPLNSVDINGTIVKKYISKLKVNEGPGPDGLPPILYSNLRNHITVPLTSMFTAFLRVGNIPDIWKKPRLPHYLRRANPV